MKVRVIYPVRPDWREHEEQVFDVGEVEAPTALDACEMMFAGFNVVGENPTKDDPGWYNTIHHCRSLSVGDIVEVDGIRYRCMPAGFRKMKDEEENKFSIKKMFS